MAIMAEQSLTSYSLILRPGASIVTEGHNTNPSTRAKVSGYLYVFGIHQLDEIVHNDIDTIFVKSTMRTKAEEIEFETFALYHAFVWDVIDVDCGEVGLPRNGAESRELRADKSNPVITLRMLIAECLQDLRSIIFFILRFFTKELKPLF
jgi:hypothetical protein